MTTRTWASLLADYHDAMRAAGRSAGTIRLRRYQMLDLADRFPRGPASVTADDLVKLLGNDAWGAETRKSHRSGYRAFFRWAHRTGRLPEDPSAVLEPVHVPRHLPRPVPEKVLRQRLRVADGREQFMMELGAYAGLRCCEIARVHGDHWDGSRLRVVGKGGKERSIRIVHPPLVERLDSLAGWAFPNRWTGEPISPGYVTKLLSAALGETFTGHQLRHRYGTKALAGTGDIAAVGESMGHASFDTTRIYTLISEDALLAVARAAAA